MPIWLWLLTGISGPLSTETNLALLPTSMPYQAFILSTRWSVTTNHVGLQQPKSGGRSPSNGGVYLLPTYNHGYPSHYNSYNYINALRFLGNLTTVIMAGTLTFPKTVTNCQTKIYVAPSTRRLASSPPPYRNGRVRPLTDSPLGRKWAGCGSRKLSFPNVLVWDCVLLAAQQNTTQNMDISTEI